ncbi:MAG: VOC family protein [Alphaproteobacteria bacterium]|nr:VOC family protein [Alphaproteobacteria bacterium]
MDVATYPTVQFKPRRFTHINMWVSDIDRSMRFFSEILRGRCAGHRVRTQSRVPNQRQHAPRHGAGRNHPQQSASLARWAGSGTGRHGRQTRPIPHGWEMENESELVAAIRRFAASGLPYDSTVDHLVARSIYLPDPDGNLNEFYADAMKDWRVWFMGQLRLITGVWNPGEPERAPTVVTSRRCRRIGCGPKPRERGWRHKRRQQ